MTAATQETGSVRRQLRGTVAVTVVLVLGALALLAGRSGGPESRLEDSVESTLTWMRSGQGCDDWVRYSDTSEGRELCERSTDHTLESAELVTASHRSDNGQRCAVAKIELAGPDGRATWAFTRTAGSDRWAYTGAWDGLRSVTCGGVA
ncbi:MAG: hypothetical protein PGN07_11920 [Aeromicrobium erythreum]